MTPKHYEALAAAVRDLRTFPKLDADDVAVLLADHMGSFNPNFDRRRFYKACGHTRAGGA